MTSPIYKTNGMPFRRLGPSGLRVPLFSLGGWLTIGGSVVGDPVKDLVKTAFDHGINMIDTAETYSNGKSEKEIGRVIKELGLRRSDLIITTKIFFGVRTGPNDTGLSRKHIVEGLKESLERLQMEYVDVVFAHRPDNTVPMEEVVRAFNHVIERGWALYWGTSEWSARETEEAHHVATKLNLIGPIVEQCEHNMFHRERPEKEYEPIYRKYGTGTTVFSALAAGLLTGKYNDGIPEGSRFANEAMFKGAAKGLQNKEGQMKIQKVRELTKLANTLQTTPGALALAWVAKNPNTSTVIIGASKPQQILDNLKALEVLPKLTPQIMENIDKLLGNKPKPEYPRAIIHRAGGLKNGKSICGHSMFGATIKFLSLIVLPNPKFTIPASDTDPVYRIHRRTTEHDTSYISDNLINLSSSGPVSYSTPKKQINAYGSRSQRASSSKRRNTIGCTNELATASDENSHTIFSSFTHSVSVTSSQDCNNASALSTSNPTSKTQSNKIRIATPSKLSPTRMSRRRKLEQDIFALYSSKTPSPCRPEAKHLRKKKGKGKEKRRSAPPVLTRDYRAIFQTGGIANLINEESQSTSGSAAAMYAIPHAHLISSNQIVPPIIHRNQRTRPHSISSSYVQRSFEADLSPIIEDTPTWIEPLTLNEVSMAASTADNDDSGSTQSYGQLLENQFNPSQYATIGGVEWSYDGSNEETSRQSAYSAQLSTQGFGDIQDRHWQTDHEDDVLEDSILIPELTLTMPTPDIDGSAQFCQMAGLACLQVSEGSGGQPGEERISGTDLLGYELFQARTSTRALDLAISPKELLVDQQDKRLAKMLSSTEKQFGDASIEISAKKRGTRRPRFRWSMPQHIEVNKGEIEAGHNIGRLWKGFPWILPNRAVSSENRVSPSNLTELQNSCGLDLSHDWGRNTPSFVPGRHSRLGSVSSEEQATRFPGQAAPVLINEEGEHAASPLFGLPDVRKTLKKARNVSRRDPRVSSEYSRMYPRRHSFGFSLKRFVGLGNRAVSET